MLIVIFIIGYVMIALEEFIKINKSSVALITGVLCWLFVFLQHNPTDLSFELTHHLGEISGILFFLLGAMTIVELIDAHNGFDFLIRYIKTSNKRILLLIITIMSFFMSAVLDNLTTTIVFTSIVLKIIKDAKDRTIFASMIVVSSNAGGVWSPVGDVTTTMLWMGNQITTSAITTKTFFASLCSVAIPLIALSLQLSGRIEWNSIVTQERNSKYAKLFFFTGLSALLFVPVFKSITGLPPFMGMLFAMGLIWLLSELIDRNKDEEEKQHTSINFLLKKIDSPSILFFLGILLAVSALSSAGILISFANAISIFFHDITTLTFSFGILSAFVDNVPLVAAAQNMFLLSTYATDHPFWLLMAYTTGVGGSLLIIGSAAGIAAMGMTKIKFFWYLKNVSLWVMLGYLMGWAVLSMTLGS